MSFVYVKILESLPERYNMVKGGGVMTTSGKRLIAGMPTALAWMAK